jgi:hypothetical protein
MSSSWFSRFQKRLSKRAHPATRHRPRLHLETLEERSLMSNLYVVPLSMPNDNFHYYTLANAASVANPGDTITIDLGASPDPTPGAVNINVPNLTIQGDPTATNPYKLPSYDLNLNASTIKLQSLNLGTVQAASGVNNETIWGSNLVSFTELGAFSGSGHNTLSHDLITGFVDLQGNSGLLQVTKDLIFRDIFNTSAKTALKVANSNLTTVEDNTIVDVAPFSLAPTGIAVNGSSDHLVIANNHIHMTSTGLSTALILTNAGGALNALGATVLNNTFESDGQGTALEIDVVGNGSGLAVVVQGNDFHANWDGVAINGVSGPTGAGQIDLGGGSTSLGSSLGGNSFRSFDGFAGHYSIQLFGTDPGIILHAENNFFSNGILPHATVIDGAISGSGGSGVVDVTAMQPKDLVGRVSSTGDWWVAKSDGKSFINQLRATWNPNVTWVDVHTGNFTGDGKTDIIGRVLETGQWWVAVPGESGGYTTSLWTTWSTGVTWADVKVGDFNGDGRDDIVGRALQSGQLWVAQSTGVSFTNSLWATWSTGATWVDVQVGNFQGGVKQDIAGRWLQGGQWWVSESTGTSFTSSLWTTWSTAVTWVDVNVGDFNGDGKADIVGRAKELGQWWVAESTGGAFTDSLWATWSTGVTWVDVRVGDFNSLHMSSIAGRAKESGQWWVGASTGASFNSSLWATWSTGVTWVDVQVGDFNGDGLSDITGRCLQDGTWWTSASAGTSFDTSKWAVWSTGVNWVDVQDGVVPLDL